MYEVHFPVNIASFHKQKFPKFEMSDVSLIEISGIQFHRNWKNCVVPLWR